MPSKKSGTTPSSPGSAEDVIDDRNASGFITTTDFDKRLQDFREDILQSIRTALAGNSNLNLQTL